MSKKLFSTFIFLLAFGVLAPFSAFASTTDGTIDSTYKYAWSENLGWINFGTSEGNVHVTDASLTGYAWNENTGWISLYASSSVYVANNAEGTLSGYAWGEGIGYIDFSAVTIDSDGFFHGYASSTLGGRINFNCNDLSTCGTSDFRTKTDWRKASTRSSGGGSGGGGGGGGSTPISAPASSVSTSVSSVSSTPSSQNQLATGSAQKTFHLGDSGAMVTVLQKFLNGQGYVVSRSGGGSPGKEGNYFGKATQSALSKLQLASGDKGVVGEKGFLGPKTLTYIIGQIAQKMAEKSQVADTVPASACSPYLIKYIKSGVKNDTNEVRKLQNFLSTDEGFTSLKTTGFYGTDTFNAVTTFQNRYASDVLGPWGHDKPTGYVYQTTKKKINELYCMYRAKENKVQ